jgi:Tfp pilus assembly PilM family ATPase
VCVKFNRYSKKGRVNLVSNKDISSTEKLLDVIRGTGGSSDAGISREKTPSVKKTPLFQVFSGKASRASTVVGVDVGYHELRLVKISQDNEGRRRLKDFKRAPFIEGVNPDSPEFIDFLRKALADFCGRGNNFELWALMQSGEVEVQHVRVPKMSSKKVHDAVYFLAKKNVPFDEKNTIFDYGIQGEVVEGGVQKLAVVAYTSPREEVRKVAALFDRAGFSLTGLTIAPFAIQNIFKTNWIPSAGKVVVTLYIGRDWSRIDIYNDGNFVMTRGIKTGINSSIESLMDEYNNRIRRTKIGVIEDAEQAAVAAREYEKISMTIEDAREIL